MSRVALTAAMISLSYVIAQVALDIAVESIQKSNSTRTNLLHEKPIVQINIETDLPNRVNAAVSTIQNAVRVYLAKKKLHSFLEEELKRAAASTIQKAVRVYLAKKALYSLHEEELKRTAASIIQNAIGVYHTKTKLHSLLEEELNCAAASTVQNAVRVHLAKKKLHSLLEEELKCTAASTIQNAGRIYLAKINLHSLLEEELKQAAVSTLQNAGRVYLAKKKLYLTIKGELERQSTAAVTITSAFRVRLAKKGFQTRLQAAFQGPNKTKTLSFHAFSFDSWSRRLLIIVGLVALITHISMLSDVTKPIKPNFFSMFSLDDNISFASTAFDSSNSTLTSAIQNREVPMNVVGVIREQFRFEHMKKAMEISMY